MNSLSILQIVFCCVRCIFIVVFQCAFNSLDCIPQRMDQSNNSTEQTDTFNSLDCIQKTRYDKRDAQGDTFQFFRLYSWSRGGRGLGGVGFLSILQIVFLNLRTESTLFLFVAPFNSLDCILLSRLLCNPSCLGMCFQFFRLYSSAYMALYGVTLDNAIFQFFRLYSRCSWWHSLVGRLC